MPGFSSFISLILAIVFGIIAFVLLSFYKYLVNRDQVCPNTTRLHEVSSKSEVTSKHIHNMILVISITLWIIAFGLLGIYVNSLLDIASIIGNT